MRRPKTSKDQQRPGQPHLQTATRMSTWLNQFMSAAHDLVSITSTRVPLKASIFKQAEPHWLLKAVKPVCAS